MINYTERLTALMQDIVLRVPALSFIDMSRVLVFARPGRSNAVGAFATCHCLSQPPSEPGYYFWRDRRSRRIIRRSEWFVAKSPLVTMGEREIKYLVSFVLPRFCDQSLDSSRKEQLYRGASEPWLAKLDTVVHELYHIDPELAGIRKVARVDGSCSERSHGPRFFADVAAMVRTYLAAAPDPTVYDFLRLDFGELHERFGCVGGLTFRSYPSYPQRFIERLEAQPPAEAGIVVEPIVTSLEKRHYTEADLLVRPFERRSSRRIGTRAA